MTTGIQLTLWTVRIALMFYVTNLILRIRGDGSQPRRDWARWAWTAGCASFLLHVACAFHVYHAWSHRIAYEATARDTAKVVGLDWGGGTDLNSGEVQYR